MVTEVNGVKSYTFGGKTDDLNAVERYVFRKDFGMGNMEVPAGTEISKTHGCIYYNGGLLSPEFQNVFKTLIEREKRQGWNYLKPDMPVYNKC